MLRNRPGRWGEIRITTLGKNFPLPRIHAITNDEVLRSQGFELSARNLLANRKTAVHLRGPGVSAREMGRIAKNLCEAKAPLFVNDRIDIAAAFAVTGVHLPSSGIPITRARELLGPDAFIGKSTHSVSEAAAAFTEGADYIFLGPIWPTSSHPGTAGLGPAALEAAAPFGRVIGIGGISVGRSRICADSGAYGVAAISGIWQQERRIEVVDEMLLSFKAHD